MVLLTTTPQILSVLSSLPPSILSTLSETTPQNPVPAADPTTQSARPAPEYLPLPTTTSNPISHKTLIALSRLHPKDGNIEIPTLNTLLRGTQLYKPPPPSKLEPTPEYTALMARLRAEQEQRDYEALARQRHAAGSKPEYEDEDTISPSLVFNILLSVVMCAVAVFQVTRWWASDAVRVLVSLAAGIVVGIAEVGVYSIYLMKVQKARGKERNTRERKTLIGEYSPGALLEEQYATAKIKVVSEKEEIWGRGANGGVRRRVREKWEKEQGKEKSER